MSAKTSCPVKLTGDFVKDEDAFSFVCAHIEEGYSQLTKTTVEFISKDKSLVLEEVIGSDVKLEMALPSGENRNFSGICTSAEFLGTHKGAAHFSIELQPHFWFLTQSKNSRVFQEMKAPDIISEILGDYGFKPNIEVKFDATYRVREYCVQYRESDFDFLHRLMEQEGIFYFLKHEDGKTKMIMGDSVNVNKPVPGDANLEFIDREDERAQQSFCISEWSIAERAVSGKIELNSYDFERPKAKLKTVAKNPLGKHKQMNVEVYDFQGQYKESSDGDFYSRVMMESKSAAAQTWRGVANIPGIGVGHSFKIVDHPRTKDLSEFTVSKADHYIRLDPNEAGSITDHSFLEAGLKFADDDDAPYRVVFSAIPKTLAYRAPITTPWPQISGIHTAIVTGPSGEEIYTDKYGRIKVKFHWDRLGKPDEKSSCWVRTMMPWTGKNWGMISVPRIGQEVVIQFEEGDPDRPICVGMLYNADTMPPYALPANMTQSGVKTNSSKGGNGYNELMFEDKKDAELVRFQAETNFKQIVKNDAEITVGLEKKDKGDMALTVHNNMTEIIKEGDHSFTLEKGSQTNEIKKDLTETVEGKATQTITGNVSQTIKKGNVTLSVDKGNVTEAIKMGNVKRTLDMGNISDILKLGNFTVDASVGKISLSALQKIELKCGPSSIELGPAGVTIKSVMVKVEGSGMTEIKSGGIVMIKGSMTMIN